MMLASHATFHILRSALLRRFVALVCLLGMAAAYASPVIAPRSMNLLCSTAGDMQGAMKLIVQTADGQSADADADFMHCGLCAPAAAPPPSFSNVVFASALAHATQRTFASALAALARPPLPARGPPDFS